MSPQYKTPEKSKSCQKCAFKKSKCENDKEVEEWLLDHECDITYVGSSPAMESEGAVVLWGRSIEHHNLRYKWMVSDGDSKAFKSVESVYGELKVENLDCVRHVRKRMGKHLLTLKARTKGKLADGISIGGRGRLTEKRIKQLQKYYGLAIHGSGVLDFPLDRMALWVGGFRKEGHQLAASPYWVSACLKLFRLIYYPLHSQSNRNETQTPVTR